MGEIKSFLKTYKIEILVFFIGLGVRFLYMAAIQILYGSQGFSAYSDAETFLRVAHNLLTEGVMSQSVNAPFVPDSLRTPLYPYFLAIFLWAKIPLLGIVAVQNVMAGLAGVFVYRIGKSAFHSEIIGFLAAILLSIEPAAIYWNDLLMSDNLFAFLLLWAVYLFVRGKTYSSVMMLGFSALARPIGLYFFPVFWGMAVAQHYRNHAADGKRTMMVKKSLIMAIIMFAILFPWMARNRILFHTWELSSAGWVNIYTFEAARFAKLYALPFPQAVMPSDYPGQDHSIFGYDFQNVPFYKRAVVGLIRRQPFEYFKFHTLSSIQSFANHGHRYLVDSVIRAKFPDFGARYGSALINGSRIFWIILYVAALASFFWKPYRAWLSFFAALIIVNSLLLGYIGIGQGGRYTLPVLPFLLLMGSAGFVFLGRFFAGMYARING